MLEGAQARSLLSDISRLQKGTFPLPKVKEQIERKIPHDQYEELSTWIENHPDNEISKYWNTELHFDYTRDPPGTGKNFVIRMPLAPHELVTGLVTKGIIGWFAKVEEIEEYNNGDETTIDIAKGIEVRNQTRVYLQNGNEWEPDQSFRIKKKGQKKGHIYPAVVIEVSYAQRLKDLKHRAETWIKYSTSKVRIVIGFDLNDVYKKNQSATLYVWKSQDGEPELIVKTEFRDTSGRAIPNVNLCLSLSDFLQDDDGQENMRFFDPNMLISSVDIVDKLEDGVEDQEIGKTSHKEIKSKIKAQKSKKSLSPLHIASRWSGTLRKKKVVNYKPMMKK
ncbi:hypothetical protein NKR23_g8945 [Pleurostoma richardsiae]|uniref:Uncharacterized protein n=1 Tax=Pleurostoma richardsiae TaxID=41990 RepID=A0AA38R6T4_9PEZI|nr:hypothetical protein NKR23_g8945 [Pleurostoma richardsiae]